MKLSDRKIGNITFTNVELLLIIGSVVMLPFILYVFYRTYKSDQSLISIMIIPLILGIIFENLRLSSDWKTILLKVLGALLVSIFAFMPNKEKDVYNFEEHIHIWPYYFVFFFVLFSAIVHSEKIIPKLTEGITLLQSISIIYWVIDIGFLNFKSLFANILIGIGLIFSLVSIVHAFSYIRLTRNARLFLSIWSSIIMIIFAVDHIYRVFNFNNLVDYKMLNEVLNTIQYFLLGVSLIYIFQNAYMLIVYLPDRYSWYGYEQMKDIRKMNKTHVDRYSNKQIKVTDSFIALLFTTGIYYWNYKYQIMPRHTLIWLMFWTLPFVVGFKEIFLKKFKLISSKSI